MTKGNLDFDQDLALLEYYQAIGVNIAVAEKAKNQFTSANKKPNNAINISNNIIAQNITDISAIEPDTKEAHKLAATANSLAELEKILANFDGCALKKRATQLVFSDGNEKAQIMIIGEAPGRDEDIEGKPFVGRAGQLLDKMLGAIGLNRDKVYIANIVAWRPPGNRNPTISEIASCLPFLHRQIEFVAPKIILTLGAPAAHTLFNCKTPITKLRGNWQQLELNNLSIKALPTFHPAFLLRQPAQKAYVWQDMLKLKSMINELTENA